jgi:hypothetical protein
MKVKIKTWERMKSEFGIDVDGDIHQLPYFTLDMEKEMPYNREINVINDGRGIGFHLWMAEGHTWTIADYMIDFVINSENSLDKIKPIEYVYIKF